MGINLPQITINDFDCAETSNFFIIKINDGINNAIKSFVVLLYQNKFATAIAQTGKSYILELQKICLPT